MVDLDTIDYSNLNRQFLFRAKHVGRSKAEVARESVLEFPHSEKLTIEAAHGNIKSPEFTFDFFKTFDIVLNGLDNVDARRYVNRMCLAAGVPLVESGTEGYIGQARAIIKGDDTGFKGFKCYECDPPRKTESYPICTIRNHPDKPVHCIAWAKAPRSTCHVACLPPARSVPRTAAWTHLVAASAAPGPSPLLQPPTRAGCRSSSSRSSSATRRPT